jgi:hypothetical protein
MTTTTIGIRETRVGPQWWRWPMTMHHAGVRDVSRPLGTCFFCFYFYSITDSLHCIFYLLLQHWDSNQLTVTTTMKTGTRETRGSSPRRVSSPMYVCVFLYTFLDYSTNVFLQLLRWLGHDNDDDDSDEGCQWIKQTSAGLKSQTRFVP